MFALLKARGYASSLVAGESGASIEAASFFYVKVCDANAFKIPSCAWFWLAEESGASIEAATFFYVKVCDAHAYGVPRRACQVLVNWQKRVGLLWCRPLLLRQGMCMRVYVLLLALTKETGSQIEHKTLFLMHKK